MKKIVLLCNAGMSTSMLVTKMREVAKAENYDVNINAYPVANLDEVKEEASVILLGPQVRFEQGRIEKLVECPVLVIDMASYGTLNGKSVLETALKAIGE